MTLYKRSVQHQGSFSEQLSRKPSAAVAVKNH